MRIRFATAVALLGATAAFGQTFNEVGDAPNLLPGQATGASGSPLSSIVGTMADANDADLYAIHIDNPSGFVAAVTATSGTSTDTQLFLFDSSGHGVTFDDDAAVLSRRFGTRSIIQGSNGRVPAAGTYYLAISGYDTDPLDSNGSEIWLDSPFNTQRAPDGAGAANPLAAWSADLNTGLAGYTITLRGASADGGGAPHPTPEPTTLMALGLGALAFIRRR